MNWKHSADTEAQVDSVQMEMRHKARTHNWRAHPHTHTHTHTHKHSLTHSENEVSFFGGGFIQIFGVKTQVFHRGILRFSSSFSSLWSLIESRRQADMLQCESIGSVPRTAKLLSPTYYI
jgi:hypothetical protein